MRTRILTLASLLIIGCGDDGGGGGHGGAGGTGGSGGSGNVVARFQISATTPVDVGSVPYPSDLYLDGAGKLSFGSFPSTFSSQFDPAVRSAWASMDGWGVSTGVFFFLAGGDVSAASVAGTVHLYDVTALVGAPCGGGGGPGGGVAEIGVEAGYNDARHTIAAVPSGDVLQESHYYGAVLVHPGVQPDADFATIRTLTSPPSDARLAKGWMAVRPAIDAANCRASGSIARDHIVAATVFKTQSTVTTLEKLRAALDAMGPAAVRSPVLHTMSSQAEMDTYLGIPMTNPAEEGVDAPGVGTQHALPHTHLGYVVHATLPLRSFTGTTPSEIAAFQLDASGTPMVKATYDAAFTVALPLLSATCDYTNLPLVIFVPGVKHTRSDMFALADGFAARCAAMAAIDLPFHGSRTPSAQDVRNNVTGAMMPDFVGDFSALVPAVYYFNLGSGGPNVGPYDPRALRDNLRETAADLMQLARTLTSTASIGPLRTAAGHPELAFNPDVTLIGHSLGGFAVPLAAAVDPKVKVIVIDSSGGGVVVPTLMDGPQFGAGQSGFVAILQSGLGVTGEFSDGRRDARFHPSLPFYQGVVDAGDPIGVVRYIVRDPSHRGGTPPHVWLNSVHLDQYVPNQASEPLGAVMGLTRVTLSTTPNPMLQFAMMNSTPAPYTPASGPTAAFVRMAAAANNAMYSVGPSHALIYWTHDWYNYIPPYPPFTDYPDPAGFTVDNPTLKYHRALEQFVMDYYDPSRVNMPPTVRDPYLQ